MTDDIERLIATVEPVLRGRPDYPYQLVGLAEAVAAKKNPERAAELARQARELGRGDPATEMRGRRLLASLLPGYHVPMMNDVRRNIAWDAALRRAIRPGMLVLEIGTGAGMLAMMAARAGAQVITCERDPVAAEAARKLASLNGYADRIEVVTARSQDLMVGDGLDRPADLLMCDIFGDHLFDFDPLAAIGNARDRLLAPAAPVVPMAASLTVAPAEWADYRRSGHIDFACGFDLTPFAEFVPAAVSCATNTPDLKLLSKGEQIFRFDFAEGSLPAANRHSVVCPIAAHGVANAITRWIRLDLDDQTMLEARPEPGGRSFSGLTLTPLDRPLEARLGDQIAIGGAYSGKSLWTWIECDIDRAGDGDGDR